MALYRVHNNDLCSFGDLYNNLERDSGFRRDDTLTTMVNDVM